LIKVDLSECEKLDSSLVFECFFFIVGIMVWPVSNLRNCGTIASDIYHNKIIITHAYVLYYDKSSRQIIQIIIINPILQCSSADVMIICRQKPLNSSYLTYMYIMFMVIHLNTHLNRGTRRRRTDQTGLSNISTREIITLCSGQCLYRLIIIHTCYNVKS